MNPLSPSAFSVISEVRWEGGRKRQSGGGFEEQWKQKDGNARDVIKRLLERRGPLEQRCSERERMREREGERRRDKAEGECETKL